MIHSMLSASKTQDGSPSLIRLVWCLHFSSVYIMDVATYTVRQQLPQTRVADLRFSPRATVLATWGPYFGKSPGSPVHTAWSLVVGADGVIVTHTSQFRAFSFLFVLQQGDFLLDSLVSAVCLSLDSEWPFFKIITSDVCLDACVYICMCMFVSSWILMCVHLWYAFKYGHININKCYIHLHDERPCWAC